MTIDLWDLERRLWTEGQTAFAEFMDLEAVMVFPEPIGLLYDGDILSEVEVTPRWLTVEMTRRIERRRDAVILLNYRAEASRSDGAPYHAMCTSVWQDAGTGPRIVAHQQTPSDMAVAHPSPKRSPSGQRVSEPSKSGA